MIDTHCHLNMMVTKKPNEFLTEEQFSEIKIIISEAGHSGVTRLISVGTSLEESHNCIEIARRNQEVKATAGVHPCDVTFPVSSWMPQLESLINQSGEQVVAIGEIGLDYYHTPYDKVLQAEAFIAQLDLAVQYALPVVIHIREAGDDALAILARYKDKLRGVIHCFSLDQAAADLVISWGWFIGIDGPVTYPKNHALRVLVATVPLSGLLLETDAPFLPPQAIRGKQNNPRYLGLIAQEIAQARGISVAEVIKATTENACSLFGLPVEK